MKKVSRGMWMVYILLLGCIFTLPAMASLATGDPEADGWVFGGRSLDPDIYVRGNGGFDFDIYTTAFTLSDTSNLLGDNWQAGDAILGLGGVINARTTNLTQSVRIVSKFGTAADAWSTGSSFSGGDGGDGSVLLATYSPAANNGLHLNPNPVNLQPSILGPGQVWGIPLAQRYENGAVVDLVASGNPVSPNTQMVGKLIYTFDEDSILASWQVFLNVSLLPTYNSLPSVGDRAIQTLQRSTGDYTDGLVVVIPEPATMLLLGLGTLLLRNRRT